MFRSAVRFSPDATFPLKMEQGLTQDVSVRGMKLLTPVVPDRTRPMDVWIPLEDDDVVHAKASVVWVEVEDALGDSPYWIRTGITLTIRKKGDRKRFLKLIARKSHTEQSKLEEADSKVGYVF